MFCILGPASKCPLLKVQRGTVHKAFINKTFKISCNLMSCDGQTINVTWTKENMNEWIPVSESDQMSTSQSYSSSDPKMLTSYLTFTNISKHHDGLYRCDLKLSNSSTVSHHINVSVSGNKYDYVRLKPSEQDMVIIGTCQVILNQSKAVFELLQITSWKMKVRAVSNTRVFLKISYN